MFREVPSPSIRMRGSGEVRYNPSRPLRLPNERGARRPPSRLTAGALRAVVPLAALIGVGVGLFFLVAALTDDGDGGAPVATLADTPAEPSAAPPAAAPAEEPAAAAPAAVETTPAAPTVGTGIITPADLGGAPVGLERGTVTPIPPGILERTLADGTAYDPTDATLAISSIWPPGTRLRITRLPGGPQLSEEDAARLIGKESEVVVREFAPISTALQLSPAAFQVLALDVNLEPIINVRIEVIEAPPPD